MDLTEIFSKVWINWGSQQLNYLVKTESVNSPDFQNENPILSNPNTNQREANTIIDPTKNNELGCSFVC